LQVAQPAKDNTRIRPRNLFIPTRAHSALVTPWAALYIRSPSDPILKTIVLAHAAGRYEFQSEMFRAVDMKSDGVIMKKGYDRRLPKSDLKGLNRRLLRRRELSYPENINPTKAAGSSRPYPVSDAESVR
jgi:hypothetical protein